MAILVLLVLGMGLISWKIMLAYKTPQHRRDISSFHQTLVDPNLVCMVNDTFMGKPQIPIHVNGKMYYGCCNDCIDKLTNRESLRVAVDPFSGNLIDKSKAYIAQTNQKGSVVYFESISNFEAYRQRNEGP